jgi:hypothetical protein
MTQLPAPQHRPEPEEPSALRSLIRILRESLHIAFVVGLHWGLKNWIHFTHQEDEWWARWLLSSAALYAVVGFTVIAGAELVGDCWSAVRSAIRRIRDG